MPHLDAISVRSVFLEPALLMPRARVIEVPEKMKILMAAPDSGEIEIRDVELAGGGFLVDAIETYRIAGAVPAGVEIAA